MSITAEELDLLFPDRNEAGVFPPTIERGSMNSLIRAFPCLMRKQAPQWTNNSDHWRSWMRSSYLSSGEKYAAQFILHVWNWRDNQKERAPFRFDLGAAMNTWDGGNLAAFNAWSKSPWYA